MDIFDDLVSFVFSFLEGACVCNFDVVVELQFSSNNQSGVCHVLIFSVSTTGHL